MFGLCALPSIVYKLYVNILYRKCKDRVFFLLKFFADSIIIVWAGVPNVANPERPDKEILQMSGFKKRILKNKKRLEAQGAISKYAGPVIKIALIIMVTVFPFIMTNGYFNVLETKFYTYAVVMCLMLATVLGLALCDIIKKKTFNVANAGRFCKNFIKDKADVAAVVFLLVGLISALTSEYQHDAFSGTSGRYSGFLLMFLYVASYLVISKLFKFDPVIFRYFLISGTVVMLLGITDFFGLDLLGMRKEMLPEQWDMFASTIGNINTYTSYVAPVIGMSCAMFAIEESRKLSVFYYIVCVVGFFAAVMGGSDNSYLALLCIFAVLPLIVFKRKSGIVRYLLLISTFFVVLIAVSLIKSRAANPVLIVLALTALITAFVYRTFGSVTVSVWVRRCWLMFLGVCAAVVIFMLIDANATGNADKYGILSEYLHFDDDWGSGRGLIWRSAITIFGGFTLWNMLFGSGPDTFALVARDSDASAVYEGQGLLLDNAHNEYINYLITVGILGVLSYASFLVLSGIRMIKRGIDNVYVMGCFMAVLCYCVQATVNLSLPISTPVMWLLLAIGVSICKNNHGNYGEKGV